MNVINGVDFFVFYIMPPTILAIGWTGNIAGLVTLFKRDLSKLGPVLMYRMLFIFDIICLLNVFTFYLNAFGIKTTLASQFACKIVNYIPLAILSVTPLISVYISIDRYFTIKNLSSTWLKKTNTQLTYLAFIIIFEVVIYSPFYIYSDIYQESTNFTNCFFFNSDSSRLLNLSIDLIVRDLLVFSLMITFSILIIIRIVKSRKRVIENYTSSENKTFRKDVRLAISSMLVNIVYISLVFPVFFVTYVFRDSPNVIVVFCYYFYLSSFGLNFYILLATNSLVRCTFFSLFKSKSNNTNNTA